MQKYFLITMMSSLLFCSAVYADLVDNGDGTVTDTKTGLMWQQGEGGLKTWEGALTYCENLILPNGGYTDWRLPNRNELQSLIDYSEVAPAIDTVAFPGAMSSYYWSSTSFAGDSGAAWCVGYGGSVVFDDKSNYLYVRAVRGGR